MPFNTQYKIIKGKIDQKINYRYIDQHTLEDKVNPFKLTSLILLMNQSTLSEGTKENYIIASTLVETALDTHEQVIENEIIGENFEKTLTKQLSVLGGDYYSSLYYVLLSNYKDFEFIKHLATAIKNVNELKMDFHFKSSENLKEYLKLRKSIESHIINKVAHFINLEDDNLLQAIELFLMIDILIREKEYFERENRFNYFNQKSIEEKLINHIDTIINDYQQQIRAMEAILSEEVYEQMIHLIEKESRKHVIYTEEG